MGNGAEDPDANNCVDPDLFQRIGSGSSSNKSIQKSLLTDDRKLWLMYTIPKYRVADPVNFRPDPASDPDPANKNFKTRILLALTKNQFKHLNFISH